MPPLSPTRELSKQDLAPLIAKRDVLRKNIIDQLIGDPAAADLQVIEFPFNKNQWRAIARKNGEYFIGGRGKDTTTSAQIGLDPAPWQEIYKMLSGELERGLTGDLTGLLPSDQREKFRILHTKAQKEMDGMLAEVFAFSPRASTETNEPSEIATFTAGRINRLVRNHPQDKPYCDYMCGFSGGHGAFEVVDALEVEVQRSPQSKQPHR